METAANVKPTDLVHDTITGTERIAPARATVYATIVTTTDLTMLVCNTCHRIVTVHCRAHGDHHTEAQAARAAATHQCWQPQGTWDIPENTATPPPQPTEDTTE